MVKRTTIKEAVFMSFERMSNDFPLMELVNLTRIFAARPFVMDGTITRRLRELRADHRLNYRVTDTVKSTYRKQPC